MNVSGSVHDYGLWNKQPYAVQDFKGDIRTGQAVDYNSLATVLCQRAQGSDDAIQLICVRWLRELVAVAKPELKEQYADILAAVLPSLSYNRPDIALVCISLLPHSQQLYRSLKL